MSTLRSSVLRRPALNTMFLGYDRLFDAVESVLAQANHTTFPPYDITKLGDDLVIDMAVAGMKRHQLKVEFDPVDRILFVSGDTSRTIDVEDVPSESTEAVVASSNVVHKGISSRKFTRQFTVGPEYDVDGVSYEDGLLSIKLKKQQPEPVQLISYEIK